MKLTTIALLLLAAGPTNAYQLSPEQKQYIHGLVDNMEMPCSAARSLISSSRKPRLQEAFVENCLRTGMVTTPDSDIPMDMRETYCQYSFKLTMERAEKESCNSGASALTLAQETKTVPPYKEYMRNCMEQAVSNEPEGVFGSNIDSGVARAFCQCKFEHLPSSGVMTKDEFFHASMLCKSEQERDFMGFTSKYYSRVERGE